MKIICSFCLIRMLLKMLNCSLNATESDHVWITHIAIAIDIYKNCVNIDRLSYVFVERN